MPEAIHDNMFPFVSPGSYLSRKGFSGNLDSLVYTNYGMVGETVSDFTAATDGDITYIQNSTSSPLPVELSSFSAVTLSNDAVKLSWRTETEVKNYGFNILRQAYDDKIGQT